MECLHRAWGVNSWGGPAGQLSSELIVRTTQELIVNHRDDREDLTRESLEDFSPPS